MKRILLAVCAFLFCFGAGVKAEEAIRAEVKESVKWEKRPSLGLGNKDLEGYDRDFSIYFEANESGVITHAEIVKSSGLQKIDETVLKRFKKARTKPHQIDGVAHPISATQPFSMMTSRKIEFETKPKIIAKRSLLLEADRSVVIYSEADENGNVTKAEVSKSSAIPELDAYVLSEFKRQAKFKPLSVNGKPYPITNTSSFYFREKLNTRD